VHIGADGQASLIHSASVTAANVHDQCFLNESSGFVMISPQSDCAVEPRSCLFIAPIG
jgi:hypothetical protein